MFFPECTVKTFPLTLEGGTQREREKNRWLEWGEICPLVSWSINILQKTNLLIFYRRQKKVNAVTKHSLLDGSSEPDSNSTTSGKTMGPIDREPRLSYCEQDQHISQVSLGDLMGKFK